MSEHAAMLARVMGRAEEEGADVLTLRALAEEASQAGAARALGALGLDDASARRDMDELRELLKAWRDAKRSALAAVVSWAVRICLMLLVAGMAVKLGALEMLRG